VFLLNLDSRAATLIRVAVFALVSWTVVHAHYAPGASGRELVVSISYGCAIAAAAVWSFRMGGSPRAAMRLPVTPELWPMAIGGGVLAVASPTSAGSAFVFIAIVAAGLRTEIVQAAPIAVAGAVALAVGQLVYGHDALTTLAYALGFAATLFAASNTRQSVVRAEQAELLLARNQRSHEEQLRAARLEESTRIAREIHDVLAHTLAGLTIQLEATGALIEQGADRDALLARVRRAHELAREGLVETRRAVGALRGDQPVREIDVPGALAALVEHHRGSGGAAVQLSVDGEPGRLLGAVAEAVIRVVQESLTNVRKHAPVAIVSVALDTGTGEQDPVRLIVEDRHPEGAQRWSPAGALASSGGGFGVRGMRERAAELGGTLAAGPIDGGWRVELRLPPPVGQDVAMERDE
jgi:signal transduction histidine kinase